MPRYIKADDLKQRLLVGSELDPEPCKGFRSALLAMVDTQEDADVRENVHAHWEKTDGDSRLMCSVCKSREIVPTMMGKPIVWSFCPNCGAKMDERRDDG